MLDDISFIQTSQRPVTDALKNGTGSASTKGSPALTKQTPSTSITKSTIPLDGLRTSTTNKPVSALDKATFPFPCYLDLVGTPHFIPENETILKLLYLAH